MSKHLMIDLETVGCTATAAFQQIGYALFDIESDDILSSGVIFVDIADCFRHGLTMDWSTMAWWLNQSLEARDTLLRPGVLLTQALAELRIAFEPWQELDGVWSHGASFDIPILTYAYQKTCMGETPWSHKQVRDTRTIFSLAEPEWPEDHGPEDETGKHCAQVDAVRQAKAVQSSYHKLEQI